MPIHNRGSKGYFKPAPPLRLGRPSRAFGAQAPSPEALDPETRMRRAELLGHHFGKVKVTEDRPEPARLGRQLPRWLARKMEASFGQDLSSVRVLEEQPGSPTGASAFTRGEQIHFQRGRYRPESEAGQKLIAHEIAHVLQQRQGRVKATRALDGTPVNDQEALENEANVSAERAALGQPAGRPNGGHGAGCGCAGCTGGTTRIPASAPGSAGASTAAPVMQMAPCDHCGSSEHGSDECPQRYVPHSGVEPTKDLEPTISEALSQGNNQLARRLAADQVGIPDDVQVRKKSRGRASTSGGFHETRQGFKPLKLKVRDKVLKEKPSLRKSTFRHEGEHVRQRRDQVFSRESSKAIREGLAYSHEYNLGQQDSEQPPLKRQRKQVKKTVKYLTGGGKTRWGATASELRKYGRFLRPSVQRAVQENVPLSQQLLAGLGGESEPENPSRRSPSPDPDRKRKRSPSPSRT